jgi:hypothetical protein
MDEIEATSANDQADNKHLLSWDYVPAGFDWRKLMLVHLPFHSNFWLG